MTKLRFDPASRTTPLGLARYSVEFMEAALASDDKLGVRDGYEFTAPVPVMFLVGQAIELALKALLLSKDVPLRELKFDYGHSLSRSLKKAKELGFPAALALSEEEQTVIRLLDALYSTKQLQYIITGPKTFPVFGPLQRAALKLIHAVCAQVGFPSSGLPNAA